MKQIKVTLPIRKVTNGAVHYQLGDRVGQPISDLYVRKHALIPDANGNWPQEITVTVEIPGAVTP
jgi:hypothetical protein